MIAKAFEVRDRATFVPVVAVLLNSENEGQHYLLRRCGYSIGRASVLLTKLAGGELAHNNMYEWSDRTFKVAHEFIVENWESLNDGDVIDVEFILGETNVKKVSERYG